MIARPLRHLFEAVILFSLLPFARAQWTAPTNEELSMTSQREVPGASAVYLYREETTEDKLHMFSVYVRLKVLTEKGVENGNVELNYVKRDGGGYTVNNIEGRTIHTGGTIVLFKGKPFDKLVEKSGENRFMSKIFSMPDVQVGSIIEYRYKLRYDDRYFIAPSWYIQSPLFTRKAHYVWRPTGETLVSSDDRGQLTNTIAWFPLLPKDSAVKQTRLPDINGDGGQLIFEVNVQNVPPAPDEEYMPPIASLSYRVLFYYSPYRSAEEYWSKEGKHWAKQQDKFIGPGPRVVAEVARLTTPTDTQDQKLHKIYSAVMALENSDFTRERSNEEEKSQGLGLIKTTDDILERKRGNGDQLAELFVSMARASGLKAYLFAVANRDRNIFVAGYFSLRQLDDYVAVVNVDGKEKFFDPGSRYCTYGHLAWKHTFASGVRQVDGATKLDSTPGELYTFSRVQRIANLTMDEHGVVNGTVELAFTGAPALRWRQQALRGDETSMDRDLRVHLEHMLPAGMEVKVASIDKLNEYEQMLVVKYAVKGLIGSSTGKRLLVPGVLFESNTKPAFPHEKRENAIYFNYPWTGQDAVRVTFPSNFKVESTPVPDTLKLKEVGVYSLQSQSATNSVTMRRNLSLGEILFMPNEYPDLRTFYGKMENKDQESVVLTCASN